MTEVDGEDGQRDLAWYDFVPSTVKPDATEETVFAPLQDIVDHLKTVKRVATENAAENAEPRTPQFSYRNCPNTRIKSEIPGTNFRVDACITSNPGSEHVSLSDTAAIAEYKKGTDVTGTMDVSACASCRILNQPTCTRTVISWCRPLATL